MLGKSEGIVLQSIKYGDSGRILTIYTLDKGLQSFIAQGLNSRGNLKKTHFQHLNVLQLHYYAKQKSNLFRLKEAKIVQDNSKIPVQNIYALIFTAEFLKNCIKEEEPNALLYNHIRSWIQTLHMNTLHLPQKLSMFCVGISRFLGFEPMNNQGKYFNLLNGCFEEQMTDTSIVLSESSSKAFKQLLNDAEEIGINELEDVFRSLMRFFSIHLQNFNTPKSAELLTVNFY